MSVGIGRNQNTGAGCSVEFFIDLVNHEIKTKGSVNFGRGLMRPAGSEFCGKGAGTGNG
jgi:hypothetical protein